ncbi:MAG: putative nucleotidyltransferase with HDIG domain [Verrucomicrobiales bacterium]|jgi:putative nucleotidyltransferase with HDIG domain
MLSLRWEAPTSVIGALARFVTLAIAAMIVATAADRVARRFLPLAALLRLSLVFPDQAPSRFVVALRSNDTRKLEQRLADLDSGAFRGDEAEAARVIVELAACLSKHDRLTRGHSERVRAYTALIAEEMGLSDQDSNRLQWAGLIHDVGKLRVPYEILTKPGKLTEREFEIIKTHPAEGMRIAAPLAGFLGEWINAVGEHHERFDGGGYPNGLVGNQISLGGRIVAVADTYDVITPARSYKKPKSAAWARAELARCSGTQFDPEVVRAFLNVGLGEVRRTMWPLAGRCRSRFSAVP